MNCVPSLVSSPNVRVVFVNEKIPARKFGRLRHGKGLENTFYPGFWRGYHRCLHQTAIFVGRMGLSSRQY